MDRYEGLDLFLDRIEWFDAYLDSQVSDTYREHPLAQDWARVAKVAEETGESIQALIGMTGQNPRKGFDKTQEDLLSELADTALTAIYAIQHFTKNPLETWTVIISRSIQHKTRVAGGF